MKIERLSSIAFAALAAALCISVVWFVDHRVGVRHLEEQRAKVVDKLGVTRAKIEASLNSRLNLAESLSAFVKSSDEIRSNQLEAFVGEFQTFSGEILKDVEGIKSLQLAPDGVVTYINPVKGNEAAIGHDLRADPARRDAVERAILERKFIVAGPVELRQGGVALIGRMPIFMSSKGEQRDKFWGFSIILIDMEPLLMAGGLLEQDASLRYAVRGKDSLGAKGSVFYGEDILFNANPVIQDIYLPNGYWQIAAVPVGGWGGEIDDRINLWIFGTILSGVVGFLLFVLLNRPAQLRKAYRTARESEERFRQIFNKSAEPILLIDPLSGRFLDANEEAWKLLKYSRAELLKIDVATIHPHDFKETTAFLEMVEQYGMHKTDVLSCRTKLGDIIPAEISAASISIGGKQRLLVQIHDISDLRQAGAQLKDSEERFRSVLDNLPSFINLKDRDGHFQLFNRKHSEVFDVENCLGKTSFDIHSKEMAEEVFIQEQKVIETKSPITQERHSVTKQRTCDFLITKFPILDETGAIKGIGTIGTDITEWKKLEEQLLQAQKMEGIGQLTGGIAHDFNNLMGVIMGNLEMAKDELTDEERNELISNAISAVDRGATLTQQLLSFSRKQILSPKVDEASKLVADNFKLLERTLGENIEIETTFSEEPLSINIDTAIFGNALLNLSLNARDAMPNGGKLSIATTQTELDGEITGEGNEPVTGLYALVTVSDTGGGIDKDNLDRVVEPFYTTKEVGEGSGLGLSMVYGFIEQSGGHMTIDSEQGKGTIVSLYIPMAGEKADEDAALDAPCKPAPQSRTILVVEDDLDVLKTTSRLLRDLGYEVLEAADGPSAGEVLAGKSDTIDMVFSDVVMPKGMSGIELAEWVRDKYQHIKILLTSGYPDIAHQDSLEHSGIKLLAKPYKKAQLANAIDDAFIS